MLKEKKQKEKNVTPGEFWIFRKVYFYFSYFTFNV